jgi:hypothetical protein
MGYREALEAAGAKVLDYKAFGDYQGTWIAITDKGVIVGSYGSCSGCDAFEAEFGYSYEEGSPTHQQRLAKFGQSYLDTPVDLDKMLADAQANVEWDDNAALIHWIKEVRNNQK